MATDRTVVKGVKPDMTREAFVAELARAKSPATGAAGAVYDYAASVGLSPAFLLGIFAEESSYATNTDAICVGGGGVPEPTSSWGNTTENDGKPSYGGTGRVVRGRFSVYADWVAGGTSTVQRLFDYAPYANLRTVREIIAQWAPASENRTENYIAGVVATMTRLGTPAAASAAKEATTVAIWKTYDLRGQLPTRQGGGSGRRTARKLGGILHYSAVDYPRSRPTVDILIAEARFHIGPYLDEAGIAYHKAVDPYTGDRFILRDEEEELWHCGYWGPGGNGTGIAYHVPGGSSLVMTPVAVRSLVAWFEEDRARHGYGRAMIKGHNEVSQTTCPGPLLDQVITPYRAGTLNATATKTPIIEEEDDVQLPPIGVTEARVIDGQAVTITNWGPPERDVVEVNVNTQDQNVAVKNRAGIEYGRSQRDNVMQEFYFIEPRK